MTNSEILNSNDKPKTNRLKVKTANEWIAGAKDRAVPKKLFGDFWLEGELCILFSDTGKGKSILAVQIAESIARGEAIEPVQKTAGAQPVVYIDFELSDKQFEMRYAEDAEDGQEFLQNHYRFSDNFIRAEIDLQTDDPERLDDETLLGEIREIIATTDAKVLIVDNVTFMNSSNANAATAFGFMKELKELKLEMNLSILVLAHTPKREAWRPLNVNDLQGSKHLSNFADNIFAVGQSRIESDIRYIKHIKPRSTELIFDVKHVPTFAIAKRNRNFLSFQFENFGPEGMHLMDYGQHASLKRAERVQSLANQGRSQRSIAEELGVSLGSVNRYMQMTLEERD